MKKDTNNRSKLETLGLEPVETVMVPVIERFIEDEDGNLIGVTASGTQILFNDTRHSSSEDE